MATGISEETAVYRKPICILVCT